MKPDINYKHLVRIPWKHGDTISSWNEVCASAIEQFGLPGNKFITHPTEEYMDFMFKDEKDAIVFNLKCL
jgi:hypothetical protein